jgi:hypothetical protein
VLLTVAIVNNNELGGEAKGKPGLYCRKCLTHGKLQLHEIYLTIPINLKKCIICLRNYSANCLNMLE